MKDKRIALLIDIDNVKISSQAVKELFNELKERGEVLYCKFYGYNDRKHIYLSDLITKYGYETAPFMRFKKRFSQVDNRILVDAVKLNYTKPEINTYCIVAGEGDLIPLLVELKSSGRVLIDVNTEHQDINGHMFDEHVVLANIEKEAEVYTSKASKTKVSKPKKVEAKATVNSFGNTSALLREVKEDKRETREAIVKPATPNKYLDDNYNLAEVLREITDRYNELDFNSVDDIPEKLELIKDMENLIEAENSKGEGIYSTNSDVRQIFKDLQEIVNDIKNSL